MTLYLPDTNIFIYAYHGEQPYARLLSNWILSKSLCISTIVVAEFLSGGVPKEQEAFLLLLKRFRPFPIDEQIAIIASAYKRKFSGRKPGLRLPDALIAASAKATQATLVTNNRVDFPMKDISILSDF